MNDAIDATPERLAREVQDDINRKQGQFLLDVVAARMRQGSEEHPALEVLRPAHQEEADKE